MKCWHGSEGYEWHECPKCGKTVRVNRKRKIVRWCLGVWHVLFGAELVADWGIEVFRLADKNPHNAVHAAIGGISILIGWLIMERILPIYDEK